MKKCNFQFLAVDYFFNELDEKQKKEFENHLSNCVVCKSQLESFAPTASLIKKQKRQLPDKALVKNYHEFLKNEFYRPEIFSEKFKRIIGYIFIKPSIPVRIAEATVLIIIGILIGRITFWNTPTNYPSAVNTNGANQLLVNEVVLNNYLQETEMIFLDVANINDEDEDVLLNLSQLAQLRNLLSKTNLCRDQAVELNDEKLVNLIDDIELILLELCNVEKKSLNEKLYEIREQIKDSNLLFEITNFTQQEI